MLQQLVNQVQNKVNQLDYIAMFSTFLGVLNYQENLKQTSNDELMEEIKNQTHEYLEKIIEQNNEIITLLKEGKK